MKARIDSFISRKSRTAIGLSMLDVISNALASIILLFFVLVALRALPPPPERVMGVLIVDYEVTWDAMAENDIRKRQPEIEIGLRGPDFRDVQPQPRFGSAVESTVGDHAFDTGEAKRISGVWPTAKVLQSAEPGRVLKRVFYLNPECPSGQNPCTWEASMVYVDDTAFYDLGFDKLPDATMRIQAWFVKPAQGELLKRADTTVCPTRFPTELKTWEFTIPTYQRVEVAGH
ncbi:MAG: hypothetical protein IPJ87_01545 [Flavobacteriales bacterium]|nr:hypothetical protein [Flavobacteriales bacterium]MBK7940557.1 hypothetical protein [Flavobacteriales bacterium]MBK8950300.1 hypothetical protein [Flavobacteriales bacterium]MBK9701024.1 hypothetical protein [Flavobacteriales bacterium]